MRLAVLATAAMAACGCEDLVTVEVALEPFAIERDLRVGAVPAETCPVVTRELTPPFALAGSATLAPVEASCVLTVHLESAVLVDRATVSALRAQLAGADTTALLGVTVEVRELTLSDAGGSVLDRARVDTLELIVDGVSVVPRAPPDEATGARVLLPRATVDELLAAIDEDREARADLGLRLAFTGPAAIPPWLRLRVVLAPALLVDAVRAAL